MSSHRRVKDIAYDEDELYSDSDEAYDEDQGYTAEDRQNFADLTPVVQAHLTEADIQATNREIEEALWHYYWDVAKSVEYLKKQHTTKNPPTQPPKQAKPKDKFDQAADRHAVPSDNVQTLSSLPPEAWFDGISWESVPQHLMGELAAIQAPRTRPKLLGGSSKLAKLAEERRKKAGAVKHSLADTTNASTVTSTMSSLDRLTLGKTQDMSAEQQQPQSRKYPAKRKKEATPPPAPPVEEVVEIKEDMPDLRAAPSDFGRTLAKNTGAANEIRMSIGDLFGSTGTVDAFEKPSPDDIVLRAHGQSKSATKPAPTTKTNSTSKTAAKESSAVPATQTVLKAKPNLPDPVKLWTDARPKQKPFASFVVAGHVDHGKSTLMGRLLLDTGAVQQRDIDKFKKQASEIGKESFALAWVMDTGSEERERGVTVDIAQHNFSTKKADFTILDAPGHRDFVPNMISGAAMADFILLVVDANQLDSGIKGQTREHVQLAYGVGIRKVVVAVNKLDVSNPPWSQDLFDQVYLEIQTLLRKVGFNEKNMLFIPCSGLKGENVASPAASDSAAAGVKGDAPCLVAALESFTHDDAREYHKKTPADTAQAKAVEGKPLRLQVADVYRGGIQNPLTISGRIISGSVTEGQVIMILPSNDQALVKGIERAGESTIWAVALQIVSLHLDGDMETLNRNLRAGDLICSQTRPVRLTKTITTKIQVLETILPQAIELHFGRLHVAASIKRLVTTLDGTGASLKKSPRSLKPGQIARVEITTSEDVALETTDRVILRADGATIAFGIIETASS